MIRTLSNILTGVLFGTLAQAQESPKISLLAHGYEDESSFVVYQAPSQLLTQFKEYTIKDDQGAISR